MKKGHMIDSEFVRDDIQRIDHGDVEIANAIERVRRLHLKKGLPYVELLRSQLYGSVKYLLREEPDGTVTVSDLDTNESFLLMHARTTRAPVEDEHQRNEAIIRKWIEMHKAA